MTSEADRKALLRLARHALTAHISGTPLPVPDLTGAAGRRAGAFVTLHHRGELRGCIGHVDAVDPLGRVVVRCAVSAASADPRFPRVTAAELAAIAIELSILRPLEAVSSASAIEVGRHGLLVEAGWRRGLLLPQVAGDRAWDAQTFIEHTCLKAGLTRAAWPGGATLWRFEAEVFSKE